MDDFGQYAITPSSLYASTFIIQMSGREVLRITADGELIFADASKAAEALLEQWSRLRGGVGAPADPEAFG